MQGQAAIRNVDLLRRGHGLRTGEGSHENYSQDAVSHHLQLSRAKWRPCDEIITPLAVQAGQYHKLVVRADCSLAFPGCPRVTMFWVVRTHRQGSTAVRMHGGEGA